MKSLAGAVLLLAHALVAHAGGQTTIPNYATAYRGFFWEQLYVDGGRDLYCNVRSREANGSPSSTFTLRIGSPRITDARNRNECPVPAYGFAEADLHNLWQAIGAINSSRGDKRFGEI